MVLANKKALITGVGGFVGWHLSNFLLTKKIEVVGIVHPKHKKINVNKKIKILTLDLLNKKSLGENLRELRFNYIFHLAAFASPAKSFDIPQETLENNIISQLNLLETLTALKSEAKILIVGSAEEYGDVDPKYLPVDESTPLSPISPYAVSKVAQDMLGFQFFSHNHLRIVRVRPFNHIGPGQSTNFVTAAFAAQIAQLEKLNGGEMKVGNLNTSRDFTDVRDITKAYLLALDKGAEGEVYNIGSGTPYKIAHVLKKLLSFTKVNIKVIVDKKRFGLSEVKKVYSDFTKFKSQTGWEPTIPIETSLLDTLNYERSRI